ncbi:MAG: T9SS type A sorting domain-containing protein [candidate division KSB1 bacterium]|nr:T9SS type A sorting domain-containing protein [candidate division KSB1 bacterium]
MYQNYPNPFNPKTTITFDTPEKSRVQLAVYDVLGRKVQILTDQVYPVGRHSLVWDTWGLPSGVYFIRMNARGSLQKFTAVRKVMLIR